ncbi:hypothetical protein MJO28_004888 [Puccinia striiformis f. sp. tritici]|uniref:Protein-serine/threonine kinase n=2 Tax=Puccinia striiformis f. sp. tritici TaxID=168172 RepID=A0A0L0VEK6_9BASI|nr:uncharacterized protein Pst134EA_031651 [Puccinia striiformis f. sp. tritici]KAH9442682.1 hypothetical protein Pst134EA_031651 [Puccinia striiformis f. sp. tritici]KAI7954488.1 hypothetical protein MJO28_004888 [Puccinia striiformis f. sp. tritici]KNE97742.1 hypothetical protein PSTG_08961 [Puccinia striiformis f. sp. tritici PST-78]
MVNNLRSRANQIRFKPTSHLKRFIASSAIRWDIPQYAHSMTGQSLKKVSLDRLIRFGTPPLSPSKIIESGELTRNELSQRLQRRVNAHLSLPYLPASNPHIKQVMSIYRRSLEQINALPPIKTVDDNSALVKALVTMVDNATDVIGMFATGFKESKRYLSEEQISSFLNRAIQSRISIRLIAEQHLSLSKTDHQSSNSGPSTRVGIVDKKVKLEKTLEGVLEFSQELCEGTYGIAPEWKLLGEVDAEVCFVEMHLQYVLIEVIKNAMRATVEHHREVTKSSNPSLPPIEVTISVDRPGSSVGLHDSDHSLSPNAELSQMLLCIRIRDHGGGIDPQNLPHVFSYAFSTVGSEEKSGQDLTNNQTDFDRISYGQESLKSSLGRIAGLGFGLPMARLYCRYFGGNLELVNIHGVGGGVDSYITVVVGS